MDGLGMASGVDATRLGNTHAAHACTRGDRRGPRAYSRGSSLEGRTEVEGGGCVGLEGLSPDVQLDP